MTRDQKVTKLVSNSEPATFWDQPSFNDYDAVAAGRIGDQASNKSVDLFVRDLLNIKLITQIFDRYGNPKVRLTQKNLRDEFVW